MCCLQMQLARVCVELEQWSDAYTLFKRLIVGCIEQLGEVHTTTLAAKSELASVLVSLGKHPEAQALCDQPSKINEGEHG